MATTVAMGFREAEDESGQLGAYLQAATAMEKVRAGKESRARFLSGRACTVLDVGCGTGDAVRLLAADSWWDRIVGVDHNPELLAGAAVIDDQRVELLRADAADLPFADGEFGAVMVERTLQHVEDPARVVSEAARVVAPGGSVLVVEPDWGTLAVDGGDPTVGAAVLAATRTLIRHPGVGRSLRRLLANAGLGEVVVDAEVHETGQLDVARFLGLLDDGASLALREGTVTPADLDTWWSQLGADAASGRFSCSLALFVAVGRRPTR